MKNIIYIIRCATIIIVALSLCFVILAINKTCTKKDLNDEIHHDTITRIVTVKDFNEIERLTKENDSLRVELTNDNIVEVPLYDTIRDSVFIVRYVRLPVEQVYYDFHDTAKLWVSGYGVNLDSAKFYVHKIIENRLSYAYVKNPNFRLNGYLGFGVAYHDKNYYPELNFEIMTGYHKWILSCNSGLMFQPKIQPFIKFKVKYLLF